MQCRRSHHKREASRASCQRHAEDAATVSCRCRALSCRYRSSTTLHQSEFAAVAQPNVAAFGRHGHCACGVQHEHTDVV